MDIEDLLRELGAVDRAWRQHSGAAGAAPRDAGACWPAWRILLSRQTSPEALDAWCRDHGRWCPRCRQAYWRVLDDVAVAESRASGDAVRVVRVFLDGAWGGPLGYAAQTPPSLACPAAELPLVQYHQLRDTAAPALHAAWCVTWEGIVYVLLVAPEDALREWHAGAELVDAQGRRIGSLREANAGMCELLAPGGTLDGLPVLCLQCQVSLAELQRCSFTIPKLLSGEIRFAPAEVAPSLVQELVVDLASRNRVGRFLAGLPEQVGDRADAMTLNFYLRLLHQQGRLSAQDKARLSALAWLAEDLRQAFENPGEARDE